MSATFTSARLTVLAVPPRAIVMLSPSFTGTWSSPVRIAVGNPGPDIPGPYRITPAPPDDDQVTVQIGDAAVRRAHLDRAPHPLTQPQRVAKAPHEFRHPQ